MRSRGEPTPARCYPSPLVNTDPGLHSAEVTNLLKSAEPRCDVGVEAGKTSCGVLASYVISYRCDMHETDYDGFFCARHRKHLHSLLARLTATGHPHRILSEVSL